ncbi:hypothetical protein GAS19_11600 [Burkholderia glumae]|uniref:hypothetical protein n=1 Tax=Burkholderia glumae TaxID=337 RepID=UPI0012964E29|nr:hypothetical protein [Burkholderia glumae]QGA38195.1 hypothetical protein GAS19_11600 [Burkholderia glumae]
MAATSFFHGITTTIVDSGPRTIAVPSSSVVGMIDTYTAAPDRAYAIASSDDTRAHKAGRFAGLAGNVAGGLMGAKIGAMIGSLGGPIGAGVLGLIGGAVGSFAGEKALHAIANKVFGGKTDKPVADTTALAKAKAVGRDVPASNRAGRHIEQTNTFAPVFHVRIEANESEVANRFLAQVSPLLTQMMAEQQRKVNNRTAMFDAPHM